MAARRWWAYRHVSGTLHVKLYFDRLDIDEAIASPFVARVVGPFDAVDRTQATRLAIQHLDGEQT